MRWIGLLPGLLLVMIGMTVPVHAAGAPSIHGGGSVDDMTRFALAIDNGVGHFECLMPSEMTVEASVTGVDSATTSAASFHGTAQVTLGGNNPFGLPPGPMVRNAPFTASVLAGGPGIGLVDLEIMGMSFRGNVIHGRVSITP